MIYLDNGATSFIKPPAVRAAVLSAMGRCANPGRGGYKAAMVAAEAVYSCRESAAKLFDCQPEQVAFTSNCTHGLNIAIRSLVQPGDKVAIVEDTVTRGSSPMEAAAVVRELGAEPVLIMPIVDRGGTCGTLAEADGFRFLPLVTAPDLGFDYEG